MKRSRTIAVCLCSAAILALAFLGPGGAAADSQAVSYAYLLGAGPLCALDPAACPDIAMASNGDQVEIRGAGSLTTHPDSVTGAGTFVHKNAAGVPLAAGTWTAEQLLSFDGFGCGFLGNPDLCGGHAAIRVHLVAAGGVAQADAILQVDCLIGKPPAGDTEGVRLAVSAVKTAAGTEPGINFNKKVSGATVFIA